MTQTQANPVSGSAVLPIGSRVNERGHLEVGGCDLVEVAREFGTPAYVYAEDDIRSRARSYLAAFEAQGVEHEVLFASKAAPFTAAVHPDARGGALRGRRLGRRAGDGATARASIPSGSTSTGTTSPSASCARRSRWGSATSSVTRSTRSSASTSSLDKGAGRPDPRDAGRGSLHPLSVQTGGVDSKFGFGLEDGLAEEAIERVLSARNLHLVGLHAHIGSQILELEPFVEAIAALGSLADPAWCRILNVGGGLGIAYVADDDPPSIETYVDVKVAGVRKAFPELPKILVEPGRSLVGNAGVTVYTVGTVKEIPGVRTYVAVDGGMSDNMRPDALRLALRGSDRRPPRGSRGGPGDGRGDALRVGRHPDPRRGAPRPPRGRSAGDPGDRAPTVTRWRTTTTA